MSSTRPVPTGAWWTGARWTAARWTAARWTGTLLAAGLLAGCSGPVTEVSPGTPTPRATSTEAASPTPPADPTEPPSPTSEPETAEPPGAPPYRAEVRRIDADLRRRMTSSWRPGCPVPLRALRHLRISYVDFRDRERTGELVVHADSAEAVTEVFRRLYRARWPIARMELVDEYGGDDDASMAANNTSAFNCREVSGGTGWSEHAYGRALDVNPVQNPYVTASFVAPERGRRFADVDRGAGARTAPGVIRADDVVVRAFARIGWGWGGTWTSSKDYQHFSASGS